MAGATKAELLGRRRAGVLAHITSLPGPLGNGDFSHDAHRFVEFMVSCGFSIWQVLPLNPTHADGSPYFSFSANAGNPLLISLDWLVDRGWLSGYDRGLQGADAQAHRHERLHRAHQGFVHKGDAHWRRRYGAFCQQADWLEDFAAFTAINDAHEGAAWTQWPAPIRDRRGAAYEETLKVLAAVRELVRFQQFVFYAQWAELRAFARARGVYLFGDLPIFVAHHSADVWAHPELFRLDARGEPEVVAGVPPDYFSRTGQVWGNPLYRWEAHEKQGFAWWLRRLRTQQELFDLVRIDHFRGLEACWEIPAGEQTAVNGRWVKAPGDALLNAAREQLGELPLIAEDLGEITPEVEALRQRHALPGMRVLQFGFDGGPDNLHLPHNYEPALVAYTGTHDNAVTREWYQAQDDRVRATVARYLHLPSGDRSTDMPDPLIEAAYASVARLAVIPMQDVLRLGAGHRMNTPGTTGGDNWRWRFDWSQLPEGRAAQLAELARLYNRPAG